MFCEEFFKSSVYRNYVAISDLCRFLRICTNRNMLAVCAPKNPKNRPGLKRGLRHCTFFNVLCLEVAFQAQCFQEGNWGYQIVPFLYPTVVTPGAHETDERDDWFRPAELHLVLVSRSPTNDVTTFNSDRMFFTKYMIHCLLALQYTKPRYLQAS